MKAVLFDMGGVLTSSPFENFAAYERSAGLPADFIRLVNSTNPHSNAWSQFETGGLDSPGFIAAFEAEARQLGHRVDGEKILECLEVEMRPEVLTTIRRIQRSGLLTALLTNNVEPLDPEVIPTDFEDVFAAFDAIVQSCLVGVRKPEPRFYQIACELVGVAPSDCVFIDDLGINLKPARAMGMTTIKAASGDQVVAELSRLFDDFDEA